MTALAESGTLGNFESFAPAGTVILYEHSNFGGVQKSMTKTVDNLKSIGFNDKTSSIRVGKGIRVKFCKDGAGC